MQRKKTLNIRQLEAILACNQSDGYLKLAARESLNKLTRARKSAPANAGA
jgi:hypothetical protein